MKKLISVLLAGMMALSLAACGNKTTEDKTQSDNTKVEESTNTETTGNSKPLIVYFSRSGNTRKIAENIKTKTNADIFEIQTVQDYPTDYDELVSFAKDEQQKKARPELKTKIDNLDNYDTIYLGYPNWWGDMPMPVYNFLDTYDLSGKTIAPFCTHGVSGLSDTENAIKDQEKNANVLKGLAVKDTTVDDADSDVESWLKETGMVK